VVSVRVDRHANALIPSIKAGKNVFVEWPIEANYFIAKELTDLVNAHKVRNVVGLQGNFNPIVKKVKALIDDGEIGKVVSSTINITTTSSGPAIISPIGYFTERKIGGNPVTINFGHALESVRDSMSPLLISLH
jgi:predicted dehydrogenase